MSDLGIFIDESGDTGSNSDFYIVTLVFHDQSNQIDSQIQGFESELVYLGLSSQSIVRDIGRKVCKDLPHFPS